MGQSRTISRRFFALRKPSPAAKIRDYKAEEYRFVRMVDRKFLDGRAAKVLDLGCGEGALDAMLSKHYSVTGVDRDPKAIRRARKTAKRARFINADMLSLSMPERFDMIVSADAIDHGPKLRRAFESVLRIARSHLSEGGTLVFDIGFVKELWKNDAVKTYTVSDGATRYIRVFGRSAEGNSGRYYDVFIKSGAQSASAESYSGTSDCLLSLDGITSILKKLGFTVTVYDGWSNRVFKSVGNDSPVFVAVKAARDGRNGNRIGLMIF